MKLSELSDISDGISWDIADDVYDTTVVVSLDKEKGIFSKDHNKWYDRMYYEILKKVEIVKVFNGAFANAICSFSRLFSDNIELWKKYTEKHWLPSYHFLFEEDEGEYIYQLIQSLHSWLAGYVNENEAEEIFKIVSKCKE